MIRYFFVLTLLLLNSSSSMALFALKPVNNPKTIGIKEALLIAREYNAGILNAKLLIEEQEYQKQKTLSLYMPKLDLGATQKLNIPSTSITIADVSNDPIVLQPAWQFDAQITLIQPIFNLSALRLLDTADLEANRRKISLQLGEEELNIKVTKAYFEATQAQNNLDVANSWLKRAQKLRDWVKRRQNENFASTSDLAKSEIEVAKADNRVALAKHAADLALGVLGVMLGKDTLFAIDSDFSITSIESETSFDTFIESALANRTDLALEAATLQVLKSNHETTYSSFYPQINFVGQGAFTSNPSGLSPASLRGVFMIQGTWSIYDGGNRYSELRSQRLKMQIHENNISEIRNNLASEIRGHLLQIENKRVSLRVQGELLKLQASVYDSLLKSHEAGLILATEVISASQDLKDIELEHSSLTYELGLARIELAHVLGRLEDVLN